MKRPTPLLAACALLLSLDTAAQPPYDAPKGVPNCQNSCVVTVILAAGCGSGIRVAPDPITIPRGNSATITWNIVPASPTGWKFAPDGISIQGLESYAKNKFKLQPGDHTFTAAHQNNGAAAFKYDINLVKGTGPTAEQCKLDPTILDW